MNLKVKWRDVGGKKSWARVARLNQACAQKVFACSFVEVPHIAAI